MKQVLTIVLIALVVATASGRDLGLQSEVKTVLGTRVLDSQRADLDLDGRKEVVAITCNKVEKGHPLGGEIVVLRTVKGKLRPLWRHRNLNPWKLVLADVDGDGRKEVIVGVWKKSPKDPVMAKRSFVYYWNGKRLMPKWLGSRLTRRFDDFTLADINHDGWAEIVSLEVLPGGLRRVSAYRWLSFGFEWIGGSKPVSGASSIDAVGGKVTVSGPSISCNVEFGEGKIILIPGRKA